jgi:hypothetical protein
MSQARKQRETGRKQNIFCSSVNISGEHVASIFRVEEKAKQEICMKQVTSKINVVRITGFFGLFHRPVF